MFACLEVTATFLIFSFAVLDTFLAIEMISESTWLIVCRLSSTDDHRMIIAII